MGWRRGGVCRSQERYKAKRGKDGNFIPITTSVTTHTLSILFTMTVKLVKFQDIEVPAPGFG